MEEKELLKGEKKKKKIWIIPLIILLVVILVIGGYFGYFYGFKNTERYIDTVGKEFSSALDELFEEFDNEKDDVDAFDFDKVDIMLDGNISLEKDGLDLFDLSYDLRNSNKNKIMAVDLNLRYLNQDVIAGKIFAQDDKLYLDSKDIYNQILEISEGEDLFTGVDSGEYTILTNPEDLKYLLNKLIEYHQEALKECSLKTKLSGINEKQYIITISASDKINADKKLEELVNDDQKLLSILEKNEIKEYNYLATGEFIFTVNTFNNELKAFSVSTSDYELTGEYDGEKYIIKDDHEITYLWISDEEITAEGYEDNQLVGSFSIKAEDGFSISYHYDGFELQLSMKEENDDNCIVNFSYVNEEEKAEIKGEVTVKETSENQYEVLGTGEVTLYDEVYKININMTETVGEDLVDKKEVINSKSVESMTEDEQNELLMNLYTLLDKFGVMDNVTGNYNTALY